LKTSKRLFYATIGNSIVLLCIVLFLIWSLWIKPNESLRTIVYIDNIKLYTNFNMTKDLERHNETKINRQKKKLDSLYTLYRIYAQNGNVASKEELEVALRKEDQELKRITEFLSNDANEKIWSRLNSYIKTYGTDHNLRIIMGTQGRGNIMYASPDSDITEELILYINTNYEGN